MKFTHNYWGQRDITKNIMVSTKQVLYTIYDVIPMKYHKYPSFTILKHGNVLAEVNKTHYKCLLDMNA